MLALIKIRTKYLSQHACGVYWGYLFIPSMIILSLINLGSFQRRELEDGNIIKGYKLNQNRNLFNQSYSKISSDKFAILVDEENDCNIFRNQDYFNVTLECGKEIATPKTEAVKLKNFITTEAVLVVDIHT